MPTLKDLQSATKSFARRKEIYVQQATELLSNWTIKTTEEVESHMNALRKQLEDFDETEEEDRKLTKTTYYISSHLHKRMSRLLIVKNGEVMEELYPRLERIAVLGRLSNETLDEYKALSERFDALDALLDHLEEYLEQAREALGIKKKEEKLLH